MSEGQTLMAVRLAAVRLLHSEGRTCVADGLLRLIVGSARQSRAHLSWMCYAELTVEDDAILRGLGAGGWHLGVVYVETLNL